MDGQVQDKKRILIVDDSSFMRRSLRTILEGAGYDVVAEAGNGLEAMEFFYQYKPDAITMDITMPEFNGLQALKEIKSLNPKAVIVMCSAISQKAYIKEALELGASDFILKPFKPNSVLMTLKKAFRDMNGKLL